MITLKSTDELENIRRAGRIVAEVHRQVESRIRPGVSTAELDRVACDVLAAHDAHSPFRGFPGRTPFPAATCMSVNDELICGIPDQRRLASGDVITVDAGCRLDGWCADAALTHPVGAIAPETQQLIDEGRELLAAAIQESHPGRCWSDVVKALAASRPATFAKLVPDFHGHGIGRELHEDPQVRLRPDQITPANDFQLEVGLVFTIEPVLVRGKTRVRGSSNGWTVRTADGSPGVHFEQTIAICDSGPRVLTSLADDD